MSSFSINIAEVKEVENVLSKDGFDGLRVRAEMIQDKAVNVSDIPWAFPLLPKTIRTMPKVGEAVFLLTEDTGQKNMSQRYFIGPIISQNQFQEFCSKENASSLMKTHEVSPLVKLSNFAITRGTFPENEDVALVGRGKEDVILKFNDKTSEVDIRAGIKGVPTNDDDPNLLGNIIFNNVDPTYIQLKYKHGLAKKEENAANSIINMVADRINIMSNKDVLVSHNIHDPSTLVKEEKMDEIMDNLHQVPKGDELVKLLELMKGAIMHHVHPWAGMEQCGDWAGYIKQLETFDIQSILSKYVRIS